LQYFEPNSTVTMLDAVELELYKRLPVTFPAHTVSRIRHRHVTVTSQTAAAWHLKTIGDLAAHSSDVKFGAPSDFQAARRATRPEAEYGLTISRVTTSPSKMAAVL